MSKEDIPDFVESVLDCLQLCAECSRLADQHLKAEESKTHLFALMLSEIPDLPLPLENPTSSAPPTSLTPAKVYILLSEDVQNEIKQLYQFHIS